jgi:hypothetical protein
MTGKNNEQEQEASSSLRIRRWEFYAAPSWRMSPTQTFVLPILNFSCDQNCRFAREPLAGVNDGINESTRK